jgi:hypothetical protein
MILRYCRIMPLVICCQAASYFHYIYFIDTSLEKETCHEYGGLVSEGYGVYENQSIFPSFVLPLYFAEWQYSKLQKVKQHQIRNITQFQNFTVHVFLKTENEI